MNNRITVLKDLLFYNSKIWLWAIILFGIVVRLSQYLFNRSLWFDEATTALRIVNGSFIKLLKSGAETAPIGFLLIERSLIQFFWNRDYILRLFPLFCGILSLFLFYRLAKQSIKHNVFLLALSLFATSGILIYYSSEVKQYSSDVAISLFIYIAAFHFDSKNLNSIRIILFGFIGGISIWFSSPALFILVGVGMSLAIYSVIDRNYTKLKQLCIIYVIWLMSFIVLYYTTLEGLARNSILVSYWRGAFMPFPPENISDLTWFWTTLFNIFRHPNGLPFTILVIVLFFIGVFSFLIAKRKTFWVLASPVLITLIASGFKKYPVTGPSILFGLDLNARTILFIVPVLLLLIAEGTRAIYTKSKILGSILICLLLIRPVYSAMYHVWKPRTHQEIKLSLIYLKSHWQAGDILTIHWGSTPAFKYYAKQFNLQNLDYIFMEGGLTAQNKIKEINKLHGNDRVWILFSHIWPPDDKHVYLNLFDMIGTQLQSHIAPGSEIFLYNLNTKAKFKNIIFSPIINDSEGFYPLDIWSNGNGRIFGLDHRLTNSDRFLVIGTKGYNPFIENIQKLKLAVYVNGKRLEFSHRKGIDYFYKLNHRIKAINEISIISSTFVPKELGINEDARRLGIDIAFITIK